MNWKINSVESLKSNGFIFQVIWECNKTQDGFVGRLTDNFGFEIENPKVSFDQVTEEMIVGWVKEKLGEYEVKRIESVVQSMIDENLANDKINKMPWQFGESL